MTLGLNCRFSIWRIAEVLGDDEVGGAIITGTPLYTNIHGRLESVKPTQLLLEQGMEFERLWDVMIRPYSLNVRERDELELTSPTSHKFYGDRFRIVQMDFAGMHPKDGRAFLQMRARHIDFARRLQ